MSGIESNTSSKRQSLVDKARQLSTAQITDSARELVLLKIQRHPKKRAVFNIFLSEEYWSVVFTTRRVLLLSEGKSYVQLILGLLTGGLGAYGLKPIADRIKPGGGRKALDDIGENVNDSVLESVRKAYDRREEIALEGPCTIREQSDNEISFEFQKGTLTFGEKDFILADHSSYQGLAFLKAEWRRGVVILPGLGSYKDDLTRCVAFLLTKAKELG